MANRSLKTKRKQYTQEVKDACVHAFMAGGKTYKEAGREVAIQLGLFVHIPGRNVSRWVEAERRKALERERS